MTGGGAPPAEALVYAAALCAGMAAVRLLTGRDETLRRARLLVAGGAAIGPEDGGPPRTYPYERLVEALRARWRSRFGGRTGSEWLCLPLGAVGGLLGESVLPLCVGALAVPLVRRWLRRRERERERERGTAEVIELCATVAGELRAGRQPLEALRFAAADGPGAVETAVTAAARFGGDVPGALREAAGQPGTEGLLGVAACWQVAADGGAGLAAGLERVAAALRAERDQREELRTQLAGTRSTAVMLALLPVFGLVMGTALGAEPLWVLLHTGPGLGCLLTGGLLECAGLVWTARIVRRAARTGSGAA